MRPDSPRAPSLSCRRLALVAAGGAVTALAALSAVPRASGPPTVAAPAPPPPARTSPYDKTTPARNPVRLTVLVDPHKVVGWVSGTADRAGEVVRVRVGEKKETVRLGPGNTFAWPYSVQEPTRAVFRFGQQRRVVTLRPPGALPPTVCFVVDRHVYRPNQTLHFAAFLREVDARGEFVPPAGRGVVVELTRTSSLITVARLELSADDQGRVTGDYTFLDADPLGEYELTVAGFRGKASVTLAEYRKAKAHLTVAGQRSGDRVRLRFEALDFLGQKVPGCKVDFTAQVVRNEPPPRGDRLNPDEFAYSADGPPAGPRAEELDEEDRLLAETDPWYDPALGPDGRPEPTVVSQTAGALGLPQGAGEYTLELPDGWDQGRHAVVLRAVLTDANGREQTTTQRIPLGLTGDDLQLLLPKSQYRPGEPIRATLRQKAGARPEGEAILVAQRLSAAAPPLGLEHGLGALGALGGPGGIQGGFGGNGPGPRAAPADGALRRTVAAAVAFDGASATVQLKRPGAYKLVAVLTRPDGSQCLREAGCVVLAPDALPPLTLRFDRDRYAPGEALTGAVYSRFADARVLLTVRDGNGLRLWKALQLKDGRAELNEPLPAGLGYGCAAEVQYADGPGSRDAPAVASRLFHVVPAGRLLNVRTRVNPVCAPGEKVTLDLEVDRKEPMDLIVSVYDQALASLAAARPVDLRSFYLADERAHRDEARELLRRRLGDVRVVELVRQARARVKEHGNAPDTEEVAPLRTLLENYKRCQLATGDLVTLLRLAGLKARGAGLYQAEWPLSNDKRDLRLLTLIDLFEPQGPGWRVQVSVQADTFVLADYDANAGAWRGARGWQFGGGLGFAGGFGGGLGALGALGGFGGLNGSPSVLPGPAARGPAPIALLGAAPDQAGLAVRRDFSDSAYWNAKVRAGADGKARVEFKVPESLTSWQVVVTAVTKDLRVGRCETSFRTARPVMVNPILPRTFTEGDKVVVSAGVHNRSGTRQEVRVRLKVENGEVLTPAEARVTVEDQAHAAIAWTFRAGKPGFTQLLFSAECPGGSDGSLKRLPVTGASAEEVVTRSGFCKGSAEFELPEGVLPKDAVLEVRFAPSLAADLADTLDYLVEYPYGCVEQTMSRFLPAILVSQTLKRAGLKHERLERRLPGCVAAGVKRLLELQQPDGGWGWNGSGQTHEMMTPYALYGLLEAERAGYKVPSEAALKRGLERLGQFIEAMGADQAADRVYCMYVYALRHDVPDDWWRFIAARLEAKALSDYTTALALEMAVRKGQRDLAGRLAARLRAGARQAQGQVYWETAHFSRWPDDRFEVTAAALKALVAYDKDDPLVPGVLAFFTATKRGDRWNSTKDTAMIVYALCDYLARQGPAAKGRPGASFRCNGGPPTEVAFDGALSRKVVVPADRLKAGVNRVTFTEAPGVMYRLALRYRRPGPDVRPLAAGIRVTRRFWLLDGMGRRSREVGPGGVVPRGAYLECAVEAEYEAGWAMQRYLLVESPRPSCCEVLPAEDGRFEQAGTACVLREDRDALVAYHHEETPAAVVDRCVLHVELAGEYVVPAARAELMYDTPTRGHSGTFTFRVVEGKAVP